MMFSIVIATFNADKTLEACLESLRNQTFRNFEIVVADGVSTDRTLEILVKHSNEIAAQVSEKDRGIYDAWNKVIPRTKGEWLLFLGADDALWDSYVLEKAANALANTKENVAYGKVAIILPDGEILNFEGSPWEKVGHKFRHEMTIPHQGTFHRRNLFDEFGLFDPSFKICGDYDFLLRELKDKPARFLPDLIVSRMAFGGVSSTYSNVRTIIDELSRARHLNGFSHPSVYIFFRRVRYSGRKIIATVFGPKRAGQIADIYRRTVGKPRLWYKFHK